MRNKTPDRAVYAIVGLIFGLGNGLIFFGINYIYKLYPLPEFYAYFISIASLLIGLVFILFGTNIIIKDRESGFNKKQKEELRKIIREEILTHLGYVSSLSNQKLIKEIKTSSPTNTEHS